VPPGEGDPAEERRRQVVDVPLELRAVRERRLRPCRGGAGDEAERDRGGARAEAPFERDPVDEAEPPAVHGGMHREGPQREMRGVAGQLVGALALDLDDEAVRGLDRQLVPEVERRGRGVEARAEIRRRRGRGRADHASASRTASTDAATGRDGGSSTAPASFRPWPVAMQTTVPVAPPAFASAPTPAADAGSQKRPSSSASVRHARRSSSSASGTTSTRPAATSRATFSAWAGSEIRIAEAQVVGRSTASPTTTRVEAPASSRPATTAETLPPPPNGSAITSGAAPSASTISATTDFCPSIRSGLTEFTSTKPSRVASSRQSRSASSKVPSTSTTRAPTARACARFGPAVAPAGVSTTASMPALAAYAAAEAAVLPVEAQTTARAPASTARETATAIPRSLKLPVGFAASHFTHSSQPSVAPIRGVRTSGVPPSPSVSAVTAAPRGRRRRDAAATGRAPPAGGRAPRAPPRARPHGRRG